MWERVQLSLRRHFEGERHRQERLTLYRPGAARQDAA